MCSNVIALVEALLLSERLSNSLINPRIRLQDIVVELLEGCVQPIDSPHGLFPVLVRVGQGPEHHRISLDTVPALSSSYVLHKVDPTITRRNRLVLVAVPFREDERARVFQPDIDLVSTASR